MKRKEEEKTKKYKKIPRCKPQEASGTNIWLKTSMEKALDFNKKNLHHHENLYRNDEARQW